MGCYTVVRLRVGIDSISQQTTTSREPFRHPLWLAAAVVFAFLQAGSAALAIEVPVLAPRLVGFPKAYVGVPAGRLSHRQLVFKNPTPGTQLTNVRITTTGYFTLDSRST